MEKQEHEIIDEQIGKQITQFSRMMPNYTTPTSFASAAIGLGMATKLSAIQANNFSGMQAASKLFAKNISHIMPEGAVCQLAKSLNVYGVSGIAQASLKARSESWDKMMMEYNRILQSSLKCFATQFKLSNAYGTLINVYEEDDEITEDEKQEISDINAVILDEIYSEKSESSSSDAVIVMSPINNQILEYLSNHPEELYQLQPGEFEEVMTEIYRRLGYDVQRTKETRDGGKDIIIRRPEILGDFIYYVECKRYAPKRPISVGIVRQLVGTINTDNVNGGIIATTSYFSRDARKYVSDNKLGYQVKMQDYKEIQHLLKRATEKNILL